MRPLIDQKVISDELRTKIAGSGLSLNHLHLAYQRNGRQGVHEVLSEMSGDCVRVTISKRITDSIADFFRSEQ